MSISEIEKRVRDLVIDWAELHEYKVKPEHLEGFEQSLKRAFGLEDRHIWRADISVPASRHTPIDFGAMHVSFVYGGKLISCYVKLGVEYMHTELTRYGANVEVHMIPIREKFAKALEVHCAEVT
jgi:hypothetical protein